LVLTVWFDFFIMLVFVSNYVYMYEYLSNSGWSSSLINLCCG
jgi:hypothetical protein